MVPVLDGEVVAVAGTTRDITERKQMEESLRESDHRKDEFIAMLAHELRDPVAPIRNAAELLSRVATDERSVAPAEVLKRQTEQLSRLLDDLLEVARVPGAESNSGARSWPYKFASKWWSRRSSP
jgi:signal transduction histidine kinase